MLHVRFHSRSSLVSDENSIIKLQVNFDRNLRKQIFYNATVRLSCVSTLLTLMLYASRSTRGIKLQSQFMLLKIVEVWKREPLKRLIKLCFIVIGEAVKSFE